MDPKSIANLDPKLRETYERVMGTTAGGSSPSTPATPPAEATSAAPAPAAPSDPFATGGPASPAIPSATPAGPASPAAPTPPPADASSGLSAPIPADTPITPTAPPDPAASLTSAPAAVFNSSTFGIPTSGGATPPPDLGGTAGLQPLATPAVAAQTTQGTSSLIKVLYIFGGIIFFIVYIFFWIKIFNYTLPF